MIDRQDDKQILTEIKSVKGKLQKHGLVNWEVAIIKREGDVTTPNVQTDWAKQFAVLVCESICKS